jgi:1-acyl-sn-glycerol-3-phosphate acyltransferase
MNLIDTFLGVLNLFNSYMVLMYIHPVESPVKKPAFNFGRAIVSKVHSTPFLCTSTITALIATALWFGQEYKVSNESSSLLRSVIAAYSLVCTSILIKLSENMIKLGVNKVLQIERDVSTEDIVRFKPPSKTLLHALTSPVRLLFDMQSVGSERIPQNTPHLFVSNHSLYGLEMPIFLDHLYQTTGMLPRGLADHFHFATPNGVILRAFGAVDGTRENVDTLMQSGESVLVYPGGGHEVLKKSSVPRHELMWKERLGFARMAIKHSYPILPCACVGVEDMLVPVCDIPTPYRGLSVPLVYTTPSRIQRIYFWFGSPISTSEYNGDFENDDFAKKVRDETKTAIENGIKELKQVQAVDPDRYLMTRLGTMWKGCSSGSSVRGENETRVDRKMKAS